MRQDCGLDPTSLAPDHWLPSNTTDKVWFWKLTTRYFFRHFLGWFDYHTISKELGLVGREIVVNPFYERYKPLNELRNILNISSE